MKQFVHLHVHTEYSMLDGLCNLEKLIQHVSDAGQPGVAITDHGAMYGALHFFNACRKHQIQPIIGYEAYVAAHSRLDKQTRMGSDQFHLTLLAENLTGYRNLMQLTSTAHLEGFSYKPRIDDELLFAHQAGVIVLSGCMSSRFNRLLLNGEAEAALTQFKKYKEVFGDRFYVELQAHPQIEKLAELNQQLLKIARQLELKVVATNDVHYLTPADAPAHDALLCVQTHKLISDTKRMSMMDSPDFYLRSTDEMIELFHETPEAIKETLAIAERCQLTIPTGTLNFPQFPLPEGETDVSYFEKLVWEKAYQYWPEISTERQDRLRYEMEIITTKGYSTYFLITQDFVNWARQQGIGVGPGRGSAAGSIVSFVLGITSIDPLQHGLAFERFLNPERPTPPDIDMDFSDNRRDEVINYVSQKYGADHVAHVITFGKMEARVAVRDVGRVLGLPYEEPDKIAKLIPNDPGHRTTLQQAIDTVPELKRYAEQPKYRQLLDLVSRVEGTVRHSSVHAAAIVITDKPLTEYTPVQIDSKSGKTITQYDMYALDCNISDDAIGVLKFDFLGLRNLSIIQRTLELLQEHRQLSLDINTIPLDDAKTFQLLAEGDTMGVFQLESAGMRRVARSLRPSQFSDITAMVALYRPGPMDLIPQFIEGKHNPKTIQYPHETLVDILQETYGVMVYQEQILQIANRMAGYSLGEADILRRAIGKKKKKLLDENKRRFIKQSVDKGYQQSVADKVWGFIEAFANYGFNKAHAASYAMIAYQTAYLKANHPVEYMTALMSVESGSHSQTSDIKVAQAVEECRSMGIEVLPPNINSSQSDFTIEPVKSSRDGLGIRFGLTAIKHVGTAAIENILAVRKSIGQFQSFTQLISETDGRKVNKTTIECLAKVGALDQFGTRSSMLENFESVRKQVAGSGSSTQHANQDSLFSAEVKSVAQDTFPQQPEYPQAELLSFEKELLGLYLTQHPMASALKSVGKRATKLIGDLDSVVHNEQTFLFGGVITEVKHIQTKAGNKPMGFGTLEDSSGKIRFVLFPKTYAQYQNQLQADAVVLIKAKVELRDEELQLIVEKITAPTDVEHTIDAAAHELFIPRKTSRETLQQLGALLKQYPGNESVVIIIPNGATPEKMALPYGVAWSDELEQSVNALLS